MVVIEFTSWVQTFLDEKRMCQMNWKGHGVSGEMSVPWLIIKDGY
jgi:hypothetical protein